MNNPKFIEEWKIRKDFTCEKNFPITRWDCRDCPYFYEKDDYDIVTLHCLKNEIREWTRYRIDHEEDK